MSKSKARVLVHGKTYQRMRVSPQTAGVGIMFEHLFPRQPRIPLGDSIVV
ncbi:unnamed protein product [Eruca vesicaria subsp. sativa]|uniref:Uncharacterized protein n=1 Tax=Eruca vesicaria subsp. sativa TaxID=29727 RepID=A0ABC8KHZ5_ERUVS|nr:unnamed protein product [Eruca vesicaria subsp. sativa]